MVTPILEGLDPLHPADTPAIGSTLTPRSSPKSPFGQGPYNNHLLVRYSYVADVPLELIIESLMDPGGAPLFSEFLERDA